MDGAIGGDPLAAWSGPRLLIPTSVDGLYGRGADLERLVDFISRWVLAAGAEEGAEILRFPPLLPRRHFEASGYFLNFASLAGTVHCFCGDEEEHRALSQSHDAGEDWTTAQAATDLVLLPAACYPVYPAIAARGPVRHDGQVIDACSYCFRHEPSRDPTRMQMFRQHERVFIGSREGAEAFRSRWMDHAATLAALLGLPHEIKVANDPFFGRVGRVMARSQREQELKLELLVPVVSAASPTACASFNLHLTKMATSFGLVFPDGAPAYTACAGFGLERMALAVLRHHGADPNGWPRVLRDQRPA
nr:amino acid--[acyl-carrier-protein] ligase [uncultured Lichenicoccus sp.]